MASPNFLPLLRHIVSNLDIEVPTDMVIKEDSPELTRFAKGKVGPMGIVGIRKEAGEALSDLASEIFGSNAAYRRGTTFKDLYDQVSDIIILSFFDKRTVVPEAADVSFVENSLERWFQSKTAKHEFYIPCSLSPWPAPDFSIGPVHFMHVIKFAEQERQTMGAMFDITYEGMFRAMSAASANWVATVAVDGVMQTRAQEIANLSVDIALAGLQLVVPLDHSAQMSRLTARTIPNSLQVVSRCNGQISMTSANQEPGLSMGDGTLSHFLKVQQSLVNAISPRVTAFVSAASQFPILEQAWADAAYWFHQGLAEPLDTIAVPKFETAVEILLRAESTSGSKSRVLKAIRAFYGLTKNQLINPKSQLTVEKFATGFVTDRSRILHGTWSTLNHSLRDSRPSLTFLVSGLLTRYALGLERYATTAGATDDVEAFLDAVELHRQSSTQSAPVSPAGP